MAYKASYRPAEVLSQGIWRRLGETQDAPLERVSAG